MEFTEIIHIILVLVIGTVAGFVVKLLKQWATKIGIEVEEKQIHSVVETVVVSLFQTKVRKYKETNNWDEKGKSRILATAIEKCEKHLQKKGLKVPPNFIEDLIERHINEYKTFNSNANDSS